MTQLRQNSGACQGGRTGWTPRAILCVVLLATAVLPGASMQPVPAALDYRTIVSRADLHYDKPVLRSEEGMPLGNGRMGSLVWTGAGALKFQINRVDVQPINHDTTSFFDN